MIVLRILFPTHDRIRPSGKTIITLCVGRCKVNIHPAARSHTGFSTEHAHKGPSSYYAVFNYLLHKLPLVELKGASP